MRSLEDYVFFFTTVHENGWASQWYPAEFVAKVHIDGEEEQVTLPSTEHWMMLQKALLFNDIEIARTVLSLRGTTKPEMARIKSLGRKVQNFDEDAWKKSRERIVFEGNLHKFQQNPGLKEKLLATGTKEIVEASPFDRIWGIGVSEKDALRADKKWGLNLLGKALMAVREKLRET